MLDRFEVVGDFISRPGTLSLVRNDAGILLCDGEPLMIVAFANADGTLAYDPQKVTI